ncbi:ABC transporter permease [Streptococcus pneumoniae]|nr:ABC transporter permease [Streptococcus pneumoniae]
MNPIQRSWAYVSRKRLRSFILFLILLVLLAGISACLTLMKSNKTVESNLYKSLNTSFSIKKIENGQTFKLSDLASVSKIKGLENVSPELETVAKLKDKEAVTGEQSVERDDLSAADNNLVSLTALEDSSKDVTFTSSAFNLIRGWINYFSLGNMKSIVASIDERLRTRLRVIIWKQWKKKSRRLWGLLKLGVPKWIADKVSGWGDHYQLVAQKSVLKRAISKPVLEKRGLVSCLDYYLERHALKVS